MKRLEALQAMRDSVDRQRDDLTARLLQFGGEAYVSIVHRVDRDHYRMIAGLDRAIEAIRSGVISNDDIDGESQQAVEAWRMEQG